MIRPQPLAAIAGPKRCPSRNGAVRLTASIRSQCSSDSDPSGGRRFTPAQLTRMSGSPNAAAAADAPRRTSARSDRSALTQATLQPASRSDLAVADSRVGSRATMTTCAPASASAEAMASPIPELPPVTTATRPSSANNSAKNPVMPDSYHTASAARDRRRANDPETSLNGILGTLHDRAGADQVQRVRGEAATARQGLHRRLLVLPGWQEAGDERIARAGAVDDPLDRGSGNPYRRGGGGGGERPPPRGRGWPPGGR